MPAPHDLEHSDQFAHSDQPPFNSDGDSGTAGQKRLAYMKSYLGEVLGGDRGVVTPFYPAVLTLIMELYLGVALNKHVRFFRAYNYAFNVYTTNHSRYRYKNLFFCMKFSHL